MIYGLYVQLFKRTSTWPLIKNIPVYQFHFGEGGPFIRQNTIVSEMTRQASTKTHIAAFFTLIIFLKDSNTCCAGNDLLETECPIFKIMPLDPPRMLTHSALE